MARRSNLIWLTSLSMISSHSRALGSESRRYEFCDVEAEGSESTIKLHNCLHEKD